MSSKLIPSAPHPLPPGFFQQDAQVVARSLLGKVLARRWREPGLEGEPVREIWLRARIVETEAYYREEKASHASLGYTHARRALFMPPGTIYMYYARGGDSFNVSVGGEGDAVLVKAAVPDPDAPNMGEMLRVMTRLNPVGVPPRLRPHHKLLAGQTLLCRGLALRVPEWDTLPLPQPDLMFLDMGYQPERIFRATRLGIPPGRDGHLLYRFVDAAHGVSATRHPAGRGRVEGVDYWVEG
ncbi:MAG: DNA-3-methyladenine glycosylase [Deltaproteobacteria bacterium]|nr:DNA-3-methyladenine glycosylase [Deltaproteobacteria bacterium]